MSVPLNQRSKVVLGLLLGLAIGALCRYLGIPSPAPPMMEGALLVLAMTSGYVATDWWLGSDQAVHRLDCGGPDGSIKHDALKPPADMA